MRFVNLSALALFACRLLPVFAQAEEAFSTGDDETAQAAPKLAVTISTSFPASEIFGVKLVNGQATQALLSIKNNEPSSVSVAFVGGNLWTPDPRTNGDTSINVRNLTSTRYNVRIPAGETDSVSFSFATELHPQDLRLQLVAVLTTEQGGVFTLNAYNETVSVVEPDASLFDPQLIFLYIMLAALFAGSVYFIYNTWIATLFPQAAKGGKGGERAKKSLSGKKVDPTNQHAVADADGPAVASGSAGGFDASWIPNHHIAKPEARKIKSGGGGKAVKKA